MSHACAVRIKRVVIRSHAEELRGVVDLELLGAGRAELRLAIRHPKAAQYEPEQLEVALLEFVRGQGDQDLAVMLPRHDALADAVRGWLSTAFAKSIFGFGLGHFRSAACTFEMPVTFLLPSEGVEQHAVGW